MTFSGFGTRAGDEAYIIGPLNDITSVDEDENYSARYFAVMGDIDRYSLTGPDWLSISEGPPLVLNTSGLEARWTFDMRNADDSSGNGHHGTLKGAQPDTGVFDIGSSMLFDGDDYIDIPHDDRLNITEEITVEAWIYPTFSDSGEHMIISKGGRWSDDDPQDYELTMDKDRPLFQMKLPGSIDWYGAAPMEPVTKNTWHHVAGTYDGHMFRIYIDGINQTILYNGWDKNYKGHIYSRGLPTSSYNISIGRRQPASWGSLFYEGRIDEVRIFDRALDDEEILEHATRPQTPTLLLSGTPDNGDVGDHQVTVSITSSEGYSDDRTFTLAVRNVPPTIMNEDITTAVQDEEYFIDYDADDEGIGSTSWSLETQVSFLSIDSETGLLAGTPSNDDVGDHQLTVRFSDGNGGMDSHTFTLTVRDVNDAPVILTSSIPNATEDEEYSFMLEADDIDGETLNWSFVMDATWLTGYANGLLTGIPGNDDVGSYTINARAEDPRGLHAEREFNITVFNVNDEPAWIDVPGNVIIDEGDVFIFGVNATDVDGDDTITYGVETFPGTDLSIDQDGMIIWRATRTPFDEEPYDLTVRITASDRISTIYHIFHINVTPNPAAVTLLDYPPDGTVLAENHATLEWSFEDERNGNLLFHVYFSDTRSDVASLREDVMADTENTSLTLEDLETGTTYYWTVIAWDGFSNGTCSSGVSGFYINTPPVVHLVGPAEGSRLSASGIDLSWNGIDVEGDNITYSVYVSGNKFHIENREMVAQIADAVSGNGITLSDLKAGRTYYWTVIPWDGYRNGTCRDGVMSFVTNAPPEIDPVGSIVIEAGERISVDINATDPDEYAVTFTLVLVDQVRGMFLNSDTGMFIWTPEGTQTGTFTVTVQASDGIDASFMNFTITVTERRGEKKDEGGMSPFLVISLVGAAVILLIAILLVLLLLVRRKKGGGEESGGGMEALPNVQADSSTDIIPSKGASGEDITEYGTMISEGNIPKQRVPTEPSSLSQLQPE